MRLPEALTGLRPGVTLDRLDSVVTTAREGLEGLVSGAVPMHNIFAEYQQWARNTISALRPLLGPNQIDHLVRSRAFWTLQTVAYGTSSAPTSAVQLVELEGQDRLIAFTDLANRLAAMRRWRDHPGTLIAADTSAYLHHPQNTNDLDKIDWGQLSGVDGDKHLLVPIAVIDELDRLKEVGRQASNDPQNPRARARAVVRSLGAALDDLDTPVAIAPQVRVEAVLNDLVHEPLRDTDAEIVERLAALQAISGRSIVLVTGDAGMSLRAKGMGLTVSFMQTRQRQDY